MSDHCLVSTRKGLFTLSRSKGGWEVTATDFLGDNVTLALHDGRDGTVYAALHHGHFGVKLHRKLKGRAWEELASPAYPPKPEGLEDLDGWGKPVKWSTQLIWALEPGGEADLWCGTMPGGLFRSRDKGETWELMESLWRNPNRNKWLGGGADLPGIHSICVDPRSSNTLRIGISCGGVWLTEDGGKSWQQTANGMKFDQGPEESNADPHTQDVHMMVQCQTAPSHFWVQHHCGIYKSTDEGMNWQQVEAQPSSFGFAVAVHPNDPLTAWFVPGIKDEKRIPVDGKLVVTRTRDGGRSFEQLSKGLPQANAYDLVFRHALSLDRAGQCLAFGSTTGNCWISRNQGDEWELASSTLPPIHAVRWISA